MFGCVVVGVGIAGKVRIRDLLTPLASSAAEIFTLKGLVSRRMLDEVQGVRQMPLEEALTRSDVQVAFICTENTSHEDYISPFLEAGKHVSVEYPMVLSYNAVADLMAQAQRKGLILHEEHIELLTPAFKQLKKDVAGKQLEEGSLHFTGGPLKSGSGFLAFSGMSRLTWLVDLFGELSVKAATMDEQPEKKHSKMTVQLLTKDQKPLTWTEERAEGLSRGKHIHLRFSTCTMTEFPVGVQEPVGLFMQDTVLFGSKLQGSVPPEQLQAERSRILHCFELAEEIRTHCQGTTA
ncbi:biliverdin reductase A isoform X1 [Tachysurus fulvidraco]|uniref:biliverdin reductase A isoform X1 n=1 Tax=Tachysurus fulvidraco TaxID=1234273 RepID=UPI001FEF81A4|nr:biliverdin reductase A isoform X1 [Tachysurus fulvidraco]XP_027004376.2 biliverdin reductase A isoform X1 [Tachysurus fulvidraco]